MVVNEIHFEKDGLVSGIRKISSAVKSTLGPRGRAVIIESPNHTHGMTVTKDGVTVAKSINLMDPVEALAANLVKEASEKTATSAGDGTTTSMVLTEAIIDNGLEMVTPKENMTEVVRYMNVVTDRACEMLARSARKVGGRTLRSVASISANNDPYIGRIIADAYRKVGRNGIVTVSKSQTSETTYEVTKGIRMERGYTSRYFINDFRKEECVMEDVYVLVCDAEISSIMSIENVLKPIVTEGKRLLIIAPLSTNMVQTLASNVMQGKVKACNIQPPQFGYKQKDIMSDIALAVGAKYYSEATGDDLSLISMADLGRASKVTVGRDTTVIVTDGVDTTEVSKRIEELWVQHDNSTRKGERDFIKERIASLSGGVGVVHVGGESDIEQKELYDRVDDAVCAVRSAMEEGIVAGGGVALFNVASQLIAVADENFDQMSREEYLAHHIVAKSMMEPLLQIMRNGGLDGFEVMAEVSQTNHGYDLKNGRYGDMFEMGVIDPLKVTRNALRNAMSVAGTILTTNAIVTIARA